MHDIEEISTCTIINSPVIYLLFCSNPVMYYNHATKQTAVKSWNNGRCTNYTAEV